MRKQELRLMTKKNANVIFLKKKSENSIFMFVNNLETE